MAEERNPWRGVVWVPRFPFLRGFALTGYRKVVVGRELIVTRDGVFVDDRQIVRRADVQIAWLTKDDDGSWFADISVRGMGFVTIGVRDEDNGNKLIRALNADARSIAASFVLTKQGGVTKLIAIFCGFFVAIVGSAIMKTMGMRYLGLAVLLLALASLVSLVWLQLVRVTVGTDGLVVRNGFRERIISHDHVVEAKRDGVDLVVKLTDGELRWPMTMRRKPSNEPEAGTRQAEDIARRINAARAAFEELGGDATAIPALARAGKTTGDWLDALRRIGKEVDAGFRGGVVGRERLWMLVESTQVPPSFRVSAAVALRISGEDEKQTTTRLREIARACATPNLGKRLRVAASASEAELAQLLEENEEITDDRDALRMRRSDP